MITKIYQMGFELRHLRNFMVIAELLSFRKAAEQLHIAQPALTRQIAQLEEALDCVLFDRQKRQISLTSAGQHLFNSLPLLFEQLQETVLQVQQVASGQAVRLRIGYSSATMSCFLPAVIHELQQQLADCEFKFVEGTSDKLIEAVLAKQLDAAFILSQPDIPQLNTMPIKSDEIGIILRGSHPLTRKKQVPLKALKDETLILFPRATNPVMFDEIIFHCLKAGFSPKQIIETAPRSTAIGLVAAGQGVATISPALQHSCIQGTTYRPLVQPGPLIHYSCVTRAETHGKWLDVLKEFIHQELS